MRIKTLRPQNSNTHRNKETDPYYLSKEHRVWRKQVFEKSRGLCVHCLNPEIKNQDGNKGRVIRAAKVADHIQPIKQGGSKSSLDNGQALCRYHDNVKTAKDRIR